MKLTKPEEYTKTCHEQLSMQASDTSFLSFFLSLYRQIYQSKVSTGFFYSALLSAIDEFGLDGDTKACLLFTRPLPQELNPSYVYVLGGSYQFVFLHSENNFVFKLDKIVAHALTSMPTMKERAVYLNKKRGEILASYERVMTRCGTEHDRHAMNMSIKYFSYAETNFPYIRCSNIRGETPSVEQDSLITAYLRQLIKTTGRFMLDPMPNNFKLCAEGLVCIDADKGVVLKRPRGINQTQKEDSGYDSDESKTLREHPSTAGYRNWLEKEETLKGFPLVKALTRLVYAFLSTPRGKTPLLSPETLSRELSLSEMQRFFYRTIKDSTADNIYELNHRLVAEQHCSKKPRNAVKEEAPSQAP